MQTEFHADHYTLWVDKEKTRAWYANHLPEEAYRCDCAGCRNIALFYKNLPKHLIVFLEGFGIDPRFYMRSCCYFGNESEVYTSIMYAVNGTYKDKKQGAEHEPVDHYTDDQGTEHRLDAGWTVHFHDLAPYPDSFDKPRFTVELFGDVPWLLNEPNPYIPEK